MAERPNPDDAASAFLRTLDKEELVRILIDDAKNWLAHDGLWFQAVEASTAWRRRSPPTGPPGSGSRSSRRSGSWSGSG